MNGATLRFPEGVSSKNLKLTMTLPPFARLDTNKGKVSFTNGIVQAIAFNISIDGVVVSPFRFDEPVILTLPFNKADVSALGIDPSDVRLFYALDDGTLVADGINNVTVDIVQGVITAELSHFSTLALASKYQGPTLLGDFDYNMTVDFYDFVQLVVNWNANNSKGDIAGKLKDENPVTTPPWYSNTYPSPPDGVIDFEDIAAFTLMYNWYNSRNKEARKQPPLQAGQPYDAPTGPGLAWNADEPDMGDTFTVTVNPGEISSFMGAEAVLSFDPARLKIRRVTSGLDISGSDARNPVYFKTNEGNLTAFTVVLGAAENGLTLPGGSLFRIEFEVVAQGAFSIDLVKLDIRDFMNRSRTLIDGIMKLEGGTSQPGNALPLSFNLSQNAPNPFNMSTMIGYSVEEKGHTTVTVFNCLGQPVKTLVDRDLAPGVYSMLWNGTDDRGAKVASGMYYYTMSQGSRHAVKRMVLMK